MSNKSHKKSSISVLSEISEIIEIDVVREKTKQKESINPLDTLTANKMVNYLKLFSSPNFAFDEIDSDEAKAIIINEFKKIFSDFSISDRKKMISELNKL